MSCDTGEGHNSAARALVGAFNRRNIADIPRAQSK